MGAGVGGALTPLPDVEAAGGWACVAGVSTTAATESGAGIESTGTAGERGPGLGLVLMAGSGAT